MSSQHDESPPDDLIRASPDLEAQTLPTEIEGLKPLAGSLSTQSVGETIEDEAFVFNFTWAGKPFQLELRGTDRQVPSSTRDCRSLLNDTLSFIECTTSRRVPADN
jgi:hypothetical protein